MNWPALSLECKDAGSNESLRIGLQWARPQPVWPYKAFSKSIPVVRRLNIHILGNQMENYETLKEIYCYLLLIEENLQVHEHNGKLESSGKEAEVRK